MANTATQTIAFYSGGKAMTSSYTESVTPNVFRTPMEGGIPKTAVKKGKTAVNMSVTYLYSSSEYASFRSWFKNTAQYGSLFFNWTNPITDDVVDARIADSNYSVTPVNARGNYFFVTINFETFE